MSATRDAEIDTACVPMLAPQYRLQFEQAQDSWVLLYPEGMVKLNTPAAEILKRCDGERDVDAVVAELEKAFETPGLSDDVQGFMQVALEQRWITLEPRS